MGQNMSINSITDSPRKKIVIISNPISGNKAGQHKLKKVIKELQHLKIQIDIYETKAPGDAINLSRAAISNGYDAIVVAGGDGTINEVANGIVGSQTPMALIPTGTINLLARELKLPTDPKALAKIIANGPSLAALPCYVGSSLFLVVASIGFDARVINDVSLPLKRAIGQWAYIFAGIKRWFKAPFCQLNLEYKNECHSISGLIAANGRYYGGQFSLDTTASVFSPTLDVYIFTGKNRWGLALSIGTILLGMKNNLKHIKITQTGSLKILSPKDEPVQADGDIVAHTPAIFTRSKQPVYLITST